MGQYYDIMCLKETQGKYSEKYSLEVIHPHQYDCGLKLMEFSWNGNVCVKRLLQILVETTAQKGGVYLGVVGDYAEDKDIKNLEVLTRLDGKAKEKRADLVKEVFNIRHGRFVGIDGFTNPVYPRLDFERYVTVYNEDLDECIVVPISAEYKNGERIDAIALLPILCAVGNGMGGGDYIGTNQSMVGRWAFCRLKAYYGNETIGNNITFEFEETY